MSNDPKEDVKSALKAVRQSDPKSAEILGRGLFTDTLVPAAGNLRAYNDFLSRHSHHQFHVHLDNNDFGIINKRHGDKVGDDALRAFGNVASKISRTHRGKFFHAHGDEWKAAFETLEQAKGFVSELHNSISKTHFGIPNYKMSFSAGVGQGRDKAEEALIEAKRAKKEKAMEPGTAENHIHFHPELPGHDVELQDDAEWKKHLAQPKSSLKKKALAETLDTERYGKTPSWRKPRELDPQSYEPESLSQPVNSAERGMFSGQYEPTDKTTNALLSWHNGNDDYHAGLQHLLKTGQLKEHIAHTQNQINDKPYRTLFRGVKGQDAEAVRKQLKAAGGKPISVKLSHVSGKELHSFTDDIHTASFFAHRYGPMVTEGGSKRHGLVLAIRVPTKQVVHSFHHQDFENGAPPDDFNDDINWVHQREHVVHHPSGTVMVSPESVLDFGSKLDPLSSPINYRWSKEIEKKPSLLGKLKKSEPLAKEMWGSGEERMAKLRPLHGWIAPNGDFHQMEDDDTHSNFISGLLGGDELDQAHKTGGIDENHTVVDWARNRGWISTGHGGDANAAGRPDYLNNPNHPATRTLGRMVANLHPDLKKERFVVDPGAVSSAYEVPHELASKGIFRKPSVTSMFRSEDLAKAAADWDPSFHGLISPEGEFHQMHPTDSHFAYWHKISDTDDFSDGHLNQGWVGVGHFRDNWVSMAPTTHDNPNHPATQALAEKVRQHPSAKDITVISATGEEWKVPRRLAEKGIFKKTSLTQAFHRSEDLAKTEAPDPLETLNRLRTNFHRTKDYLKQAQQNLQGAPPEQKERAQNQLARAVVSHAATENYFNQGVDSISKQVPHKKPGEEYRFKNLRDLETHLHTQPFAILSSHRTTRTPQENDLHHNALLEDIKRLGFAYTPMQGKWGTEEPSFMAHNMPTATAAALAQKYDQAAHLQSDRGIHQEFSHKPDYTPMPGHHGHIVDQYLDDNYSEVPFEEVGKMRFRVNLKPPETAAPAGPAGHSHGYDWHDGHTTHYGTAPVGEVTAKSESKLHPLTDKHGPAMALPQNDPIVDPGPPNWKPGRLSVTRRDSHVMVPVSMLRDKGALVNTPYRTDDPKGWSASPEHMEKLKDSMQQKGFHGLIGLNVHPDGRIEISDGTHRSYMAEKLGITHLPAEVRYLAHAESKQGLLHGSGTSDFKYQDSIPEEEFYGPRDPVEPRKSTFGTYEPSEDKTTNDIMEMLGYTKKSEDYPKSPESFNQVSSWFGVVNPIRQSNLDFYKLAPHEAAIDDLIQQHGYTVHQHDTSDQADLANKNYNTKHLVIRNPKPAGQNDINSAHARSYQKLHELAHALTLPEINKKYGEGKRVGRMGVDITPWEAKRALEWEHRTAKQQRILAGKVGYKLSDEDYNQELNTNMADAMHRVLYGHHVEPSGAGFIPKATKVSLPRALKSIDEVAQSQDLDNDGYFPKEEITEKSENLSKVLFSTTSKEYGQSQEHNAHGLISPQGEYIRIPARAEHHLELAKRTGLNAPDSMEQGWLTIGHGGESSVQGHSTVLNDPNHPATQTARRLAGQHFGDRTLLHYSDREGYNTLPRHFAGAKPIVTRNWSRFGAHVDPNRLTAFHRSEEDLEKFQTPIEFPMLEGGTKHHNLGYSTAQSMSRTTAAMRARTRGDSPEPEYNQYMEMFRATPESGRLSTGAIAAPQYVNRKIPWPQRSMTGGAVIGPHTEPATVLHENQHAIFKQIGMNYGLRTQQKLVHHLLDKLPLPNRVALTSATRLMTDTPNHEENFTHLLNYLNSPHRRNLLHGFMRELNGKENFTAEHGRKMHTTLKQTHRMLRQIAATTKFNKETGEFEGGDLPQPVAKFEGVDAPAQTGKPIKPLTVQGQHLQPNAHIEKSQHSQFNAETGELHTPRGTFKVQLHDSPHKLDLMGNTAKDYFNHIITSPDVQKTHEKAMTNWKHLNGLLAQGKTPEALVAHTALFTVLSANNAVPMQELMYSRLVDQLKDQGVDPGSVSFGQLMGKGGKLRTAWKQSDKPQELPKHSRAHFEDPAVAASIRQQAPSEQTGRKQGDIYKLQYMDAASDKLSHYPEIHKYLTDLVKKHGTDAKAAVGQMMQDKSAGTGPAPLTAGAGIGSKIGRYMYSMLGGGNSVVPDTHFIRHLFGLDSQRDTESHKYLKDLLWDPRNHRLLNGIDEHYLNNYPTVKFVQDKYFGGQKTNQALFPAFWLHWLAVSPHEKMLGIGKPGSAHNASSHEPYWDMANEILRKHGLDNPTQKAEPEDDEIPVHFRTASAMHDLETKLGPAAASMVFMAHILPHLLKA